VLRRALLITVQNRFGILWGELQTDDETGLAAAPNKA